MYKKADVEEWIEINKETLRESFKECNEVPVFMKHPGSPIENVWNTGSWLGLRLMEHGATNEQHYEICFVHGQKSLFGNPYEVCIELINEFLRKGSIKDKPGEKLAGDIIKRNVKGMDSE